MKVGAATLSPARQVNGDAAIGFANDPHQVPFTRLLPASHTGPNRLTPQGRHRPRRL
jgi:hypothetical protein